MKESHQSCVENAQDALKRLRSLMVEAVTCGKPPSEVLPQFEAIKEQGRLTKKDADAALLHAADEASFVLAREKPTSHEMADNAYELFSAVRPHFLKQDGFKKYPGYVSLSYSNTLFQILHGEVPYWDPATPISFQISRGEAPIVQRSAILAEYRTVSSGGGYQSVGLPVGEVCITELVHRSRVLSKLA